MERKLEVLAVLSNYSEVSRVEQIQAELEKLSPAELKQVRDWLEDFVEDRLEFTAEFETSIQESEREMKLGRQPRIRKP